MRIDPKIREELKTYLEKVETEVPPEYRQRAKNILKKHLGEKFKEEQKHVVIVSPYLLSEAEKEVLLNKFTFLKENTGIENIVDRSLYAGIIIKFGSKVLDLTLEGKLENLQNNLYELS